MGEFVNTLIINLNELVLTDDNNQPQCNLLTVSMSLQLFSLLTTQIITFAL
jgi:hypothetical protein